MLEILVYIAIQTTPSFQCWVLTGLSRYQALYPTWVGWQEGVLSCIISLWPRMAEALLQQKEEHVPNSEPAQKASLKNSCTFHWPKQVTGQYLTSNCSREGVDYYRSLVELGNIWWRVVITKRWTFTYHILQSMERANYQCPACN